MNRLLSRIGKAFTHPHLIKPVVLDWVQTWPYSLGDGSRAFRPREIFLYVNQACNARCAMCDIGIGNRESVFYRQLAETGGEILTVAAWTKLLEEIVVFKPKIFLNGVEPLLHDQILELVALIKGQGLYLQLVTNGILLERFADDLVRLGVDAVVVSLDGPEQVHDRIRGAGIYRQALAGIGALRQCRQQPGRHTTRISANYCISNLNCHCLVAFAEELLQGDLVDFINFTHLNFITAEASAAHNRQYAALGVSTPVSVTGVNPARVDVDLLSEQINQLRQRFPDSQVGYNSPLFSREELRLYYHCPEVVVAQPRCLTPWQSATVSAKGDVIIRSRCFTYVAGNVAESRFLEIWNGASYRSFRRELRRVGLFPVCTRCCGSL